MPNDHAALDRHTPGSIEPVARELENLSARYGLPASASDALRALAQLVAADPLAPTTLRDPTKIIEDHLADSLVALELPEVRAAGRVADLGSGAGFPGLPLAIALPGAEIALIESSERKHAFLCRAIAVCGAQNASAVRARAEEWRDGAGRFDVVTARAVAELAVVAEYAAPLLRVGGLLVAWRGQRDTAAEEVANRAALALGLEMLPPRQVHPYAGAANRHLHLIVKASPTPSRFPRRAGVARKRPLGQG